MGQGWVHSECSRNGICHLSNDAGLAAKGEEAVLPIFQLGR